MKKTRLLLLTMILFSFSSCLKDKTKPVGECSTTISYSSDIRPIIESSCKTQAGAGTGCHDSWIDDYSPIQNYIDNGTWQYEVLEVKTMPEIPNDWGIDSLTEDELTTMRCWIEQGYPEN